MREEERGQRLRAHAPLKRRTASTGGERWRIERQVSSAVGGAREAVTGAVGARTRAAVASIAAASVERSKGTAAVAGCCRNCAGRFDKIRSNTKNRREQQRQSEIQKSFSYSVSAPAKRRRNGRRAGHGRYERCRCGRARIGSHRIGIAPRRDIGLRRSRCPRTRAPTAGAVRPWSRQAQQGGEPLGEWVGRAKGVRSQRSAPSWG